MKTTISNEEGKVLVKVQGMVDTTTASEFLTSVTPLMQEKEADITMDCAELEYISSKGLRVLLAFQQEVTGNGGTLHLINVDDNIMEIFNLTGFSKIFNL